uniref:(northern house mosquito) hypothetical protein n=1 Tax=Culex pipiens TaxID=7175 RepID=A0A8D8K529_CULPI
MLLQAPDRRDGHLGGIVRGVTGSGRGSGRGRRRQRGERSVAQLVVQVAPVKALGEVAVLFIAAATAAVTFETVEQCSYPLGTTFMIITAKRVQHFGVGLDGEPGPGGRNDDRPRDQVDDVLEGGELLLVVVFR